jgi:hypothetical protein
MDSWGTRRKTVFVLGLQGDQKKIIQSKKELRTVYEPVPMPVYVATKHEG